MKRRKEGMKTGHELEELDLEPPWVAGSRHLSSMIPSEQIRTYFAIFGSLAF